MRDLVVRQIEKVAHQTPHDCAVAHNYGRHAEALELKDDWLQAVNDVEVGFTARVSKPERRQKHNASRTKGSILIRATGQSK
jgi:hypothetical protein